MSFPWRIIAQNAVTIVINRHNDVTLMANQAMLLECRCACLAPAAGGDSKQARDIPHRSFVLVFLRSITPGGLPFDPLRGMGGPLGRFQGEIKILQLFHAKNH